MKSYSSILKCAVGMLLAMLLLSCNTKNNRVTPRYTEHPSPGKVTVSFPKASKLEDLDFHIDNNKLRIFNKKYLPFESKVDSAYLKIIISTEAKVKILNETTKKTVDYIVTDTGKIDLTGGRLKLSIEMDNRPTIIYDLRLLSYGYNPSLYTWKLQEQQLPESAVESKVIDYTGSHYLVSKNEKGELSLYTIGSLKPMTFEAVTDAVLPKELMPSSILVDKRQLAWALGEKGAIYISEDLKKWNLIDTGDVSITALLSDVYSKNDASEITAVGYDRSNPKLFYTYRIGTEGVLGKVNQPLSPDFPVRDTYVYSYTVSGVQHSYILGGVTADGRPAPTSFFTSDGVKWGATPYSKNGQKLPVKGGLYLRSNKDQRVYVIGGMYADEKPTALFKLSTDRGVSWVELSKGQQPGENFEPRFAASGLLLHADLVEFYIFGGIVNGQPSREIWHGWLDRSAGIINDF